MAQNDTLSVYFDVSSYTIRSAEINKLKQLQEKIKSGKIEKIALSGYADTSGTEQFNRKLAAKRIESVRNALELTEKVEFHVIGESYTVPENNYNPTVYRRVEIIYNDFSGNDELVETANANEKGSTLISDLNNFLNDPNQMEITLALSINFVPGEDVILSESEKELEALLTFLQSNENIHAKIRGHVCCADDYQLSSARARVVFEYLVKRKIDPVRLSYKGYSNKMPVVYPEVTEQDRIRNRRVDVVFVKQ